MRFGARRDRLFAWVSVGTLLIVALLGISLASTAQAQPVYRGTMTITIPEGTFTADFVVVLHPGGPATYEIRYLGQLIDSGLLTATVSGSSVKGLLISGGDACPFTATLSGSTATGTLLCAGPGESATFVITQV